MIRKILLAVLVMAFLVSGLVFGQEEKSLSQSDFFPVAVWYSGGKARATMLSSITPKSRNEWRRDLQQIKSLGFNTVKTWVEWKHCEPREGEYNFENLRLLFELAQETGLKVFIQIYLESAPDWPYRKYGLDALFEAQSGDKVIPQTAPGYCVDHKGIREAVINFCAEAAKIAAQYPNFYGWDLWSEPHILQWGSPGWIPSAQYGFNPYTQARFRKWLKKKYKTLDELNRAWYRTFERWEYVEAPKFSTILSYTDYIDWKNFNCEKLAEDLRMRYEAVRKFDKKGVVTSHASPPSIFSSGGEDCFLMAEQVDFYGLSQYPKHSRAGGWTPWRFITGADFSYSANIKNGGYYVGELQSGFGTVGLRVGDPVTPDEQRMWTWLSVATGAKGIFVYAYYPMSSGYESGGFGLINLDGSITERAEKLGEIAHIIDENKTLFAKSIPTKAKIALVYNPLSQIVGGGRGSVSGFHQNSLIGYYRTFTEYNIPVEFIHRKDLETGDVSQYKLIIVPYPIMFTPKAAEGIKNYIEQGGNVVAEARLAWNDESGYATEVIPGMGLSEVFGIRESIVRVRDEVMIEVLDNSHPALAKLKTGDVLKGAYFAESVEPLKNRTTQILASLDDGTPCIAASSYGKGKTLFIGSFLGLANHPSSDKNNNQFIISLLDWANIVRPFKTSHDGKNPDTPIVVRLQENPDSYLLFIINQGNTREKITIDLNVKADAEFTLHEIIKNETIKEKSRNKTLTFVTDISEKEVEVWNIK